MMNINEVIIYVCFLSLLFGLYLYSTRDKNNMPEDLAKVFYEPITLETLPQEFKDKLSFIINRRKMSATDVKYCTDCKGKILQEEHSSLRICGDCGLISIKEKRK